MRGVASGWGPSNAHPLQPIRLRLGRPSRGSSRHRGCRSSYRHATSSRAGGHRSGHVGRGGTCNDLLCTHTTTTVPLSNIPPPSSVPECLCPQQPFHQTRSLADQSPPPASPALHPDTGLIPYPDPAAKTGVYAIYGAADRVVYLGKSRDIHNTLRMHLGRRPVDCVAYRALALPRPSRAAFDTILAAWAAELGAPPPGNDGGDEQARWEKPVDVRWAGSGVVLTAAEREALDGCVLAADAGKVLKKVCRRVQGEVEAVLRARGCKEPMKWAPKLKEKGLLDVGSIQLAIPETL